MRKGQKGFTLLELVVVIVVVGVLTSLALPRLTLVLERARMAEAYAVFTTIRSAMERYYLMNNGSYEGISIGMSLADPCNHDWSSLGIENPNCAPGSHFQYRVSGAGTFVIPNAPGYYIAARRNDYEFQCSSCHPMDSHEIFLSIPEVPGTGYFPPGKNSMFYCGYGLYYRILGPCT